MIRSILTLMLLLTLGIASGQGFDYHKDFNATKQQAGNKTSDLYYPKLLDRFNKNDSTLRNPEVMALLIGYTANPAYLPYETITAERHIQKLVDDEHFQEAIVACNDLLQVNPVNFTALMGKGFAYMKLGKDSMLFHKARFTKVLRAVLASGDGTRARPYFVLGPIDGQTLITHIWAASIGTMGSGHDDHGYFLDILEMKKDGKEPVKLYFNINHATNTAVSDDDIRKMEQQSRERDKKK